MNRARGVALSAQHIGHRNEKLLRSTRRWRWLFGLRAQDGTKPRLQILHQLDRGFQAVTQHAKLALHLGFGEWLASGRHELVGG